MTLHLQRLVLAAALVACLPLAGCGNKGSLVRPPAAADDAPAAAELPPETEPTEADQPAEIAPPPAADPPSDPSTGPVSGDGGG
jgi:predicted small lipoprotein YifL